jgi:hypothetical protein
VGLLAIGRALVALGFVLCLLVLVAVADAEAVPVGTAEVTLDWTGLTYTTTGSLTSFRVDQTTPILAAWQSTTLDAAASASPGGGFLQASASATSISGTGYASVAAAQAWAASDFWFYGTGTGPRRHHPLPHRPL